VLIAVREVRAKPVVVAVKSAAALIAEIRHLGSMTIPKEEAKGFQEALTTASAGLDASGVAARRPFGLYIARFVKGGDFTTAGDTAVAFVPISFEKLFLSGLEGANFKVTKNKDGTYRVLSPDKTDLRLRFANKYAYFARKPAALAGKLPDPRTFLPVFGPNTLLKITVPAQSIFQEARPLLASSLEELVHLLHGGKDQQAGESDEQYQERLAVSRKQKAYLLQVARDTREITMELTVDRKKHNLSFQLALVPRPNSPLARRVKNLGQARSRFGHLADNSFVSLVARPSLDEEWRLQPSEDFWRGLAQFIEPQERILMRRLSRALLPTLTADTLDFGLALRRTASGDSAGIIAGLKLKKGRKLEHLLRDAVKDLSAAHKETFRVKWNHARHGSTRIHTMRFPNVPIDLLHRYLLDKGPAKSPTGKPAGAEGLDVFVAIRDDVALISTDLTILKEGLDGLARAPTSETPALRLESSLTGIAFLFGLGLAAIKDEPAVDAITAALEKNDADKVRANVNKIFTSPYMNKYRTDVRKFFEEVDRDKTRMVLDLRGGTDLRLRLDLNTHLFKIFWVAGEFQDPPQPKSKRSPPARREKSRK
jgi:hypothetical protein